MYLIKVCPECKTRMRFPIDKGRIRVKCSCGYSFIADPDDTGIYRDASFDLRHTTRGLKKTPPFSQWISDIRVRGFFPSIIRGALNLKYRIQNYPLLPVAEKKKIIFTFILLFAVIIGIVLLIYALAHSTGDPERIII